ncbi:zonular occludens toxin domain-containing protein [Zoogloea sp.]|uniref:zonular occludens toxin domain-containing protein n=1 Tax=Zoogloea sp. TaxID=49181 RepID=UPI00141623B0|nr:MAG: hypothetical protein F9K15_21910 [Zoogloea sp.]
MIYLYTGVPGAGKTLFCLRDMYDFWKADAVRKTKEAKVHEGEWANYARPVYVSRVKDLAVPGWKLLENPAEWHKCEVGAIIMMDECQEDFPPRPNGSNVPEHVARIADHRHKAQDLFLITQHPSSIDNFVRRRVEQTNWVLRKFGSKLVVFYSWPGVCEAPEKSKGSGFKRERLYPKEVFSWYKSAEAHTHQFKLPREAWYFAAALVAIPLAGFVLYQAVIGLGFKPDEKRPEGNLQTEKKDGKPLEPPRPPDPVKTYLTAYTPRLEGLPHTAPAYDQMTQPTRVPVPAACVDIRKTCTCYTQDATKLNMDQALCRQIVASGFFVQFNPERERREQVASGASRAAESRPQTDRSGYRFPENDNYVGVTSNGAAVLTYDRPRSAAQVAQAAPSENVAGPVVEQAQGIGRGRVIMSQ